MITLYSGTPGSGKSLHSARDIYFRLRLKKPVIATFPVNLDYVAGTVDRKHRNKNSKPKKLGKFTFIPLEDLTVEFLREYAKENHVANKESQTVVYIDECQLLFNPRAYNDVFRIKWVNFFTQHRHLGYDFVFITQVDRLIDRQIRSLIEIEVKHFKNNNNGIIGMLIPIPLFSAKKYWYCIHERIGADVFSYNKKYAAIYDTFYYNDI